MCITKNLTITFSNKLVACQLIFLLRKYLKKKIYNSFIIFFFLKAPLNNSPFGAMINLDFMSFEKNIIGKLKNLSKKLATYIKSGFNSLTDFLISFNIIKLLVP